jgi:hypothetical protein
VDAEELVAGLAGACLQHHGEAKIAGEALDAIRGVAKVLNIAWVDEALLRPARVICPRSMHCPRTPHCAGAEASRAREITDVREEIVNRTKRGSHPAR